MATPTMKETGEGIVPAPPRLLKDEKGGISDDSIQAQNSYLQLLAQKVNRISFGDTTAYSRAGNHDVQRIPITTPSVADTEIDVDHSLGRVPSGYFVVLQNKAGSLYASSYGSWSEDTVYFKSDATGALFDILIY